MNIIFHCNNNEILNNTPPIVHPDNNVDIHVDKSNDTYVKWNNDEMGSFKSGLKDVDMESVNDLLDTMLSETDHITQENLNSAVNKIKNIFLETATDLHMIKKKRKRHIPSKSNSSPWYNFECRYKRIIFCKARAKHVRSADDLRLKNERKKAAKNYRKTVKKCKRNYDLELANKLRNLRSRDPRDYWNIINKHNKVKTEDKQPSCDEFVNMFKMFGNDIVNDQDNLNAQDDLEELAENPILNDLIIISEVSKAIKNLKPNKSHGFDNIINEFLKHSCDKMSIILMKLFNVVLQTGIVPTDWVIGIIRPIYKNKGSKSDPNNYRAITILSCLGKLFTSILSDRINTFIEQSKLLGCEQAGFRKHFSTVDHLFTIYGILDILLSKKQRLYCAFLDFEKAFDKVDRAFLWQKLLKQNINGKILKVIQNIYASAKSCVMVNDEMSDFFQVNIGVRQGENLSPILFALFLNDMHDYMSEVMGGLDTVIDTTRLCGLSDEDVNVFMKMFLLLYADDTIIFAETPQKLQSGLDKIKIYCERWKLKLNANKCKVMIFSRGKVRIHPEFKIGDEVLEVVSNFLYLGMKLNYNNKMSVAQKDLYDRASRAMFSLLKKCKSSNLPIDITIDMFEKTIVPILTYGCEVWGFGTNDVVNKLQRKFLKIILRLRTSTPTAMLHGETGTFPVEVTIKSRIMNYWYTLVSHENSNKLSSLVYRCLLNMYKLGVHESHYVKYIHKTLINAGLPYLWETQNVTHISKNALKTHIRQHSRDLYILEWHNTLLNSPMYNNYNIIKSNFGQEPYLSLLPYNCVISIIRFRTTNNLLPVNTLRFNGVDREDRICEKCNLNEVASEFHYLFVCPYFLNKRQECLRRTFYILPNNYKYKRLFSSTDKAELLKLKHFIDVINRNMA